MPRPEIMGKGCEQFEDLREDAVRYARLKWISLRLAAAENIAVMLAKAFGFVIFLVLVFIALIFLMVALALLLGEVLGQLWLGFLISGGGFLLAGAIVYLVREKMMVNTFAGAFIELFFEPKSEKNGTRE